MQNSLRYVKAGGPILLAFLVLAGAWLAQPPRAAAQRKLRVNPEQLRPARQAGQEKIIHPFDSTDEIRGYIGPMKKDLPTSASHYFVGEPVVVPFVMVNHTRFPVTILTNFNFRSQLSVKIRPEGQPQYRYNGPLFAGYYPPAAHKLNPLDEFHTNLVIWADSEIPDGLAFPKPGTYTIEVSLQIAVEESANQPVEPLRPHRGVFTITVDPTPPALQTLIDLVRAKAPRDPKSTDPPYSNTVYLQLHKNPPAWGPRTEEIVNQFPSNPLTPYLWYGLASFYAAQYKLKPAGDIYNKAAQCYQYAVLQNPPPPFMEEVYLDLLTLCDEREQASMAAGIARQFISRLPDWRLGRIGNDTLLEKYLVDTEELDPLQYWAFLP